MPFKSRLYNIILIQKTDTPHPHIQAKRTAPVYKLSSRITSLVTKLHSQTSIWTKLRSCPANTKYHRGRKRKYKLPCFYNRLSTDHRVAEMYKYSDCRHLFQNAPDIQLENYRLKINIWYHFFGGPGSSVGIVTDYGLDSPGIESRWRRDFSHTSRPALGPTQPPAQLVPGLSRG
jgi:hypothetical protein